MFFKSALVAATLAVFATATPTPPSQQGGSCNTGSVQCCNDYQYANSADVAPTLQRLGISNVDPTTLVGLQCSPVGAYIGGTGANWFVFPFV
jgi:Fungal hydrophobin